MHVCTHTVQCLQSPTGQKSHYLDKFLHTSTYLIFCCSWSWIVHEQWEVVVLKQPHQIDQVDSVFKLEGGGRSQEERRGGERRGERRGGEVHREEGKGGEKRREGEIEMGRKGRGWN